MVLLSQSARVCTLQSPFVFLFLMILIYSFICIPRLLCLCRVETLESLPVHSFNGVIISKCQFALYNFFRIPLPYDSYLYLFCIPRLMCLCRVETLESLPVHPVHSFNGVIISKCQSLHFTITFRIPLPHDSNLYLSEG